MFIKHSTLADTQILVAKDNWREFVKDSATFISKESLKNILKENAYLKKEDFSFYLARFVSAGETWGCNGNRDYFPREELKNNFQTFIRRGVYINHDNYPRSKAIGIIPYAMFDEENDYVYGVLAISKEYSDVIASIDSGDTEGTSMGTTVQSVSCPVCGAEAVTEDDYCIHLKDKGAHNAYDICHGVNFIEHSVLIGEAPADGDALIVDKIAKKRKKVNWRNIVVEFKKTSEEEKDTDYDKFIEKKLKEWGVDSLGDLNDEDTEKFFEEVEKEWTSEEEETKESAKDKEDDDKEKGKDKDKETDEDDEKEDKDKDKDEDEEEDVEDKEAEEDEDEDEEDEEEEDEEETEDEEEDEDEEESKKESKKGSMFFVDKDGNSLESVGAGSRCKFKLNDGEISAEIREMSETQVHFNLNDGGTMSLPRNRNHKIIISHYVKSADYGVGVYVILETVRDTDGGYIPCIVKDGETGYYKTDWNWGTDLDIAEELADEKNEAMGFSAEEVDRIVMDSMFPNRNSKKNIGGSNMRRKNRRKTAVGEDQPLKNDEQIKDLEQQNNEGQDVSNPVDDPEISPNEVAVEDGSGKVDGNVEELEKTDPSAESFEETSKPKTPSDADKAARIARQKKRLELLRRKRAEEKAAGENLDDTEKEDTTPESYEETSKPKKPSELGGEVDEVLGRKISFYTKYFRRRYKLSVKDTIKLRKFVRVRKGKVNREMLVKMLNLDHSQKEVRVSKDPTAYVDEFKSAYPEVQTDLADPSGNTGTIFDKFLAKSKRKKFKKALKVIKKAYTEEGNVSDVIKGLGGAELIKNVDNGVLDMLTAMKESGMSFYAASQILLKLNFSRGDVLKAMYQIASKNKINVSDLAGRRTAKKVEGKSPEKEVEKTAESDKPVSQETPVQKEEPSEEISEETVEAKKITVEKGTKVREAISKRFNDKEKIKKLERDNRELRTKINNLLKEKATGQEVKEASKKFSELTGRSAEEFKKEFDGMSIAEIRGALKVFAKFDKVERVDEDDEEKFVGPIFVPKSASKEFNGDLSSLADAFSSIKKRDSK